MQMVFHPPQNFTCQTNRIIVIPGHFDSSALEISWLFYGP
jgi:hypothetical protein